MFISIIMNDINKNNNFEHEEIIDEVINDEKYNNTLFTKSKDNGPIKIIIGIFMLIVIIAWLFPYRYINEDPHPKNIPSVSDITSFIDFNYSNITSPSNNVIDMSNFIRPDNNIKIIADKISSQSCDYSENYAVCQSKALFYFMRDNIGYSRDPVSRELIKSPMQTMFTGVGDCDDKSVLLASMLYNIGIKTRFVFIPGHVYVEAYLPEASRKYRPYRNEPWVPLDSTCISCGFGETTIKAAKIDKDYMYNY